MSTQNLLEKIYDRMMTKDTDELIAIWKENDHGLWSDSAFEVIQRIILERGVALPNQGEAKVTIPPPPKFEIPWHIPYISWLGFSLPWVAFGLFLLWVFLIHPLCFFTYLDGPLWPDLFIRFAAYSASNNIELYGKFHFILRLIELGILFYGVWVGYLVLRKSQKAIGFLKVYLVQMIIFSICLLLFFNIVPLAILFWEATNSVFDFELDWQMWTDIMNWYPMRMGSRWGVLFETMKVYSIPIFFSLIWYLFLIKSNWMAKTFPPNQSSSS